MNFKIDSWQRKKLHEARAITLTQVVLLFIVYAHERRFLTLVTHNAASPLCSDRAYGVSAIRIDVVSSNKLITHMQRALLDRYREWSSAVCIQVVSAVRIDVMSCEYEILQNRIW